MTATPPRTGENRAAAGVTRREKLARFSPAEEASLRSRPRRLDAESPRRDRLEDLEASPRAGGGLPTRAPQRFARAAE